MGRDVEAFAVGEGSSQFNSSLQTIYRVDILWKEANAASMIYSVEGLRAWQCALSCIDRELSPLFKLPKKRGGCVKKGESVERDEGVVFSHEEMLARVRVGPIQGSVRVGGYLDLMRARLAAVS